MFQIENVNVATTGNLPNFTINQFFFGSEGGALVPVPGANTAVFASVYTPFLGNAGFGHCLRGFSHLSGGPDGNHPWTSVFNAQPYDTDLGGRIWPYWEIWAFCHVRCTPSSGTAMVIRPMGELFYEYVEVPNLVFQQIVQEQSQQVVKEINAGVIP